MLKLGGWIGGSLLVAFSVATVFWLDFLGDFAAGTVSPFVLFFAGIPLALTWICFVCLRLAHLSQPWQLVNVVTLTLMSFLFYRNPGNPRIQFVNHLEGLKGKGLVEVRQAMSNYVAGDFRVIDKEAYSDLAGPTHYISYRWNDTDGFYNADVGTVYFRDGVVVETQFSPD